MVESYRAEVGAVLETLAEGLAPFVDRNMSAFFDGEDWIVTAATRMGKPEPVLATATDPAFQLEVMIRWWGPVFARSLPTAARDNIHELRAARNAWAHIVEDQPIDLAYAEHVHRLAEELLDETGSPVAADVARQLQNLRLRSVRSVADAAGISESEAVMRQLDDLQRERAELQEQLEEAREQAASATGRTRAVARQLADLQTQYAAVAGLRERYLELQGQLDRATDDASAGAPGAESLARQLEQTRRAAASLQEDSRRLADELRDARRGLADPVQTEVGRRWVMLVAALIMVLGVVIILAVGRGAAP
ncbi:MAG: Swt1 family HEPN domain-containing protein [Acidimicrobiia bacterium]|nr:Swt1 family HEPN domain-containing protein [Acidimicrobiia bacterium]